MHRRKKNNFLDKIYAAATGEYSDLIIENPKNRLAVIILLDQFTRNSFRDTANMYAYDNIALYLALDGIEKKQDKELLPIERVFIYMPLEHAEDIEIQKQCVDLFKKLEQEVLNNTPENHELFKNFTHFADAHYQIVKQFNRFPHRNKLLKRQSTTDEIEFLKSPNSGF